VCHRVDSSAARLAALAGFAFTAMTAMIIGGTVGMLFPSGTIQA
jgi:hypothetical protein